MQRGIHFISGMPRSGSTLLAAILLQNPRFHAGMTSPVGLLVMALQLAMSRRSAVAMFIDEAQKQELLKGIFDNYYYAIHPTKLVFDTNRAWCSKLPTLASLFPQSKVICCVRHVAWIMDSIERLIRENVFELSGIFGFKSLDTVYSRVARLGTNDGLVGFAMDALREAYWGEQADRLLLISYEALAKNPAATMKQLYDFIGEPWFEHDFDNVEFEASGYDLALGTPNLHRVHRRVEWLERQTVLPPELFNRFAKDDFWMSPDLNIRKVRVILPQE